MKKIIKLTTIFLLAASLIALSSGCASSKKSQCGCAGMVGY